MLAIMVMSLELQKFKRTIILMYRTWVVHEEGSMEALPTMDTTLFSRSLPRTPVQDTHSGKATLLSLTTLQGTSDKREMAAQTPALSQVLKMVLVFQAKDTLVSKVETLVVHLHLQDLTRSR